MAHSNDRYDTMLSGIYRAFFFSSIKVRPAAHYPMWHLSVRYFLLHSPSHTFLFLLELDHLPCYL